MDKRSYNIFFDLHTVSGIVISVLAYVIFFAGTFSFFRDEIINWERNEPVTIRRTIAVDTDAVLDTLAKDFNLHGRDIAFYKSSDENRVIVNLSESKDTTIAKEKRAADFFYINPETFERHKYQTSYTLGEFLYRLHFFAQIPYPAGYYLSGFTALFLLFAVVTGILVHWKKIISNFYVFRPLEKLKTVWTDAHTVMGTLGLPFHIIYSVTGAFFMINIVLVAPSVMMMYDGNTEKLYSDLGYEHQEYPFTWEKLDDDFSVNEVIKKGSTLWKDFEVSEILLSNYGDKNMHVMIEGSLSSSRKFAGVGEVVYKFDSGAIVHQKNPNESTSYLDGVKVALYRLHFGDYGGLFLRTVSFILGLFACFVVISGILIWLEARNKKHIPEKTKRFNKWVGNIYLGVCLSMYPVTALAFIVVKFLPAEYQADEMSILYWFYFITWLAASVLLISTRDNYLINKYTLISGAVLATFIPIANGIVTGNWFWSSFVAETQDLFVVDLMWILIAMASFYALLRMKRKSAATDNQFVKTEVLKTSDISQVKVH